MACGDYRDPLFRYAKQFAQAADIVVAAPYWDLSFPSILKVYLEQICVTGLTFQYTPEGIPEILCYRAENLDVIGADVEGILQEVMGKIRNADM